MTPVTANIRKIVASLDDGRHRRREGLFKAEGTKCVLDTIAHFRLRWLCATAEWLAAHPDVCPPDKALVGKAADMERMSSLTTATDVIAVYELPDYGELDPTATDGLIIALDNVRDPGNLGTIIRTADWFGVCTLLCSRGTADAFSPKVVQATMGAISRVRPIYVDLAATLAAMKDRMAVFGTFLGGENIFTTPLPSDGIIVMGNEGKGISPEIEAIVGRRLTIPTWPAGATTSESLNVATATAIVVAEFRRRCQ